MKCVRLALLGAALCCSATASAQYQWIDHSGHRVFSDRPPPASVPEKDIVSGPDTGSAAPGSANAAALTASGKAAPAPTTSKTPAETTLEKRVKEKQATEEAKKKAEQEKVAAAKLDNCNRAKSAQTTLKSGLRMARVDSKGERIVLTDSQRAAELKRTDAIIASDCAR